MRLVKLVPEELPPDIKALARKHKGKSVPFNGAFITFMPYSGASDEVKKGYWGYPEELMERYKVYL